VFDRFYRADKSRQRRDDHSSGLGLAIAKAFVETHEGVIAVESIPGHGTTFTLTFPAY
jgi:signal transduction histidine kinase